MVDHHTVLVQHRRRGGRLTLAGETQRQHRRQAVLAVTPALRAHVPVLVALVLDHIAERVAALGSDVAIGLDADSLRLTLARHAHLLQVVHRRLL